ncbi:hypothetical protein ASG40_13010 [Methylobacterium sp. Leaf399]|uniref:hypothetical protein n=1 Tax=unclassified Methylobacterium TaxID=2615210 RepID=UPI0006F21DFD|nr:MULTISPECIES: hypothetical protein [unclassified Methylobacterium]KQP50840.1 hypothetical protein ASF39_11390 [Methylobacterium sp. Leaf108]KQT07821.1 hypothetical protein ASG40_13010 [Methylobacterium sp. Leaf399]
MSAGILNRSGAVPQVDPNDLMRLFGRMPMGAPQGFAGTSGAVVEAPVASAEPVPDPVAPAATAPPAPMSVPMPPRRPLGLGLGAPAAGAMPAPAMTPTPSTAPGGGGGDPADSGFNFGDAFQRFTDRGGGDLLVGIGTGLMSTPGFGAGLSAGLKNAQVADATRATTDLAKTKLGLERAKLAKEAQGQNATKAWLTGRGLDENLATAAMSSPAVLQSVLNQMKQDASRVTIGGNIYELKPGEKPGAGNLLGPAKDPSEAERYTLTDLPDGSKAAVSRTDPTDVKIVAAGVPVRPVTAPERLEYGLAPNAPAKMTAKGPEAIGGGNTQVNVGAPEKAQDVEIGKAYGKQFVDYQSGGRSAGARLNSLALMEQAMSAPDFYSGIGAESVKRANQFLGALGVKDAKAASGAEVFSSLGNQNLLDQLGGSLGAGVSNADLSFITTVGPGLAKSPEGNRQLIGIFRSAAQRQQQIAKMSRDYAARNGGRLDAGFDDELAQFAESNPLFPAAQSAASASPPKEPPQGARQAPDGNWYSPDPARPGKFLMVR